jgi:hypothetical protein
MILRMKIDKLKSVKHFSLFIGLLLSLSSCGVYSFSPSKLDSNLKTFSIQNFTMSTAGGPQNLSLSFNEKLKEYYQRNTSLKFKNLDGDLHLEGTIVGYELTPVSATAGDKAAMNRLTITVEVRLVNKIDESKNFERDFSFFQDFSQEQSLSQAEPALVPKILDQLVLNIFTATAADW